MRRDRLPPPDKRLNMLFSATLSHRVMELAYEHMNEPELIRIEPDKVTADRVRQAIFYPSNEDKLPLLIGLVREMGESGQVALLTGVPGAPNLEERISGFEDYVADYPGIEIVTIGTDGLALISYLEDNIRLRINISHTRSRTVTMNNRR